MDIGLIGGGGISETHAQAALAIPGVRLAAICGRRVDRVRHLCERFGGTPYADLDAFLEHRPMDLVIIGSPSGLHATQGVAAARRSVALIRAIYDASAVSARVTVNQGTSGARQ